MLSEPICMLCGGKIERPMAPFAGVSTSGNSVVSVKFLGEFMMLKVLVTDLCVALCKACLHVNGSATIEHERRTVWEKRDMLALDRWFDTLSCWGGPHQAQQADGLPNCFGRNRSRIYLLGLYAAVSGKEAFTSPAGNENRIARAIDCRCLCRLS
jgi:hypothetical protein